MEGGVLVDTREILAEEGAGDTTVVVIASI